MPYPDHPHKHGRPLRGAEGPTKVYAVRLTLEEDEAMRARARALGERCSDLVREAMARAGLFSPLDG